MSVPLRSLRLLPKPKSELDRLYGNKGEIFYDSTSGSLRLFDGDIPGGTQLNVSVSISDTPPSYPTQGSLWFNSATGAIYLYYQDSSSSQWVAPIVPAGGVGGGGGGGGGVMAINFPSTGLVANVTTYTSGSSVWIWTGVTWNIKPPGSNLDDLSDVNVISATNGQVLYYNGSTGSWEPLSLTSSFNGGSIGNALTILNTTASGDYQSGALIVAGGAGIAGALRTNSSITAGSAIFSGTTITAATGLTVTTGGASITGNSTVTGTLDVTSTTTLRTRAELRFNDTDNSNHVAFRAPNNLTTNTTYQLPATDGTSGQALTTNGLGTLTWSTITGGGGGGVTNPPGGVTGNIQFNDNGAFGGVANLTYNQITDTISAINITVSGMIDGAATGMITNIASIALVGQAQPITAVSDDITLANNASTSVTTEAAVKGYVDTGLSLKAPLADPTFTGTVSGVSKSMVGLGNVENTALSTWAGSSSITTVGTLTNLSVAGNISVPTIPSQTTHATNKRYVDTRAIAMSIALS